MKKLMRLAKEKRKEEKVLQHLLKAKGMHGSPAVGAFLSPFLLDSHLIRSSLNPNRSKRTESTFFQLFKDKEGSVGSGNGSKACHREKGSH